MQLAVAISAHLSESDSRDALSRIVGSAIFGASPRLTAFLRFVVERALAGEGARIKGYTIAVEALGRATSFDPQSDPIVRVEAGRLRQRLARYYADEGLRDPVVIDLPSGSYVPRFAWRAGNDRSATAAAGHGDDALDAILRRLIGLCRHQLQAIASEVAMVEEMLDRWRDGHRAPKDGACACPPCSRLLPTAPSSSDSARPADGRQIRKARQIQQAESAAAARPRRPRPGRDRRDAAHAGSDPRGL
jgi:hypothetical protein